MMFEHVCEWMPTAQKGLNETACSGWCECGKTLSLAKLCQKANATERLSARFVTQEADDMQGRLDSLMIAIDHSVLYYPYRNEQIIKIKTLRSYVDILEK